MTVLIFGFHIYKQITAVFFDVIKLRTFRHHVLEEFMVKKTLILGLVIVAHSRKRENCLSILLLTKHLTDVVLYKALHISVIIIQRRILSESAQLSCVRDIRRVSCVVITLRIHEDTVITVTVKKHNARHCRNIFVFEFILVLCNEAVILKRIAFQFIEFFMADFNYFCHLASLQSIIVSLTNKVYV